MPTTTFKQTSMRYRWNGAWKSGEARQGFANNSSGNMVATFGEISFNFAGTVDVSNIDISSITLKFTAGTQGGAYTKYLYLHTGSYNGTALNSHSFSSCYNTTKSITFSSSSNSADFTKLKNYFEGGGTKLGVYTSNNRGQASGKTYNYDYMNITAMSLDVTYTFKKSVGQITGISYNNSTGKATATLKITPYNSGYKHKATWTLNGNTYAAVDIAAGTTTTSKDLDYSNLPNSVSGSGSVVLETLDANNNSLGSNTYTFTVTIPDAVKPTITSWSVVPVYDSDVSNTAAGWGLYIQNKTKPKVYLTTVAAGIGATGITKYELTTSPNVGSVNVSSWATGANNGKELNKLTSAVTITLSLKITDSRGRVSATSTKSITVYAYAPPQFTSTPTVWRCDSSSVRKDIDGTYALVTASFTFSSVNNKNSLTVKRVELNGTNTNLTSGTGARIGGSLATDTAYAATIRLTDAVGITTTYALVIPSAAYVMHVRNGGQSVGILQAAPSVSGTNKKFAVGAPTDIAGNTAVTGNLSATGNLSVSGNSTVGGTTVCNNDYTRKQTAVDGSAADNGVSSNAYPGFVVRDKDSDWFAAFRARVNTDGKLGAEIRVRNYVNSAWAEINAFQCMYGKDGSISYAVADKPAFQDAIGLRYTNNAAWKSAPVGMTHYRYESTTAASDYDLPYNYVHVLVLKYSSTRGVALAYRWSNSGTNAKNTGCQWMNILHGSTWTGWVQTSYTFAGADTAIGEWTDGKTLYRYCCNGSTSSTGDITTSAVLPRTPDNIISIHGAFCRTTDDGTWRPITFHSYAVAQHAFSAVVTSDKKIHLYIGSSMTGTKKWNLVIEYTA